jgi:hypothetical protein
MVGLKKEKQKTIDDPYVVIEKFAKIKINSDTYNRLIRIPAKVGGHRKTLDGRINILMDMRETYLNLFGYLRKYYPDIIGEYSNLAAMKAKGKDRFKEGYVSW